MTAGDCECDCIRAAELRQDLVRRMVETGSIRSTAWEEAFEAVPRHAFAPTFYRRIDGERVKVDGSVPEQRECWLATAYSDDSLVTHLDEAGNPVSSSTQPSVMAFMLEALEVKDGHAVLEVGTGTGFNAALLSRRLGSNLVTSVEIDPDLANEARRALNGCGYSPFVVAANGLEGYEPKAPYDRIIATCSVQRVPVPWLAQIKPGGLILANVGHGVIPLRVQACGSVEGQFLPSVAAFIEARPDAHATMGAREAITLASGEGQQRPARLPSELDDDEFTFFLRLAMPGVVKVLGILNPDVDEKRYSLADPDTRSWARISAQGAQGTATQSGSRRLWDELEQTYACWQRAGCPPHEHLGLSITPDGRHHLWVEAPGHVIASCSRTSGQTTRRHSSDG